MKIFSSVGKKHINGHKELTNAQEIRILPDGEVKKIYLPIVGPNGVEMELLVKEGDSVQVGTRVALRKDMYVPLYAPVSGTVVGKEMRYAPGPGRNVNHLVIENDGKNTKLANALIVVNPETASAQDIVNAIKEAGMVGLGGAGFPTFIKYNNAKGIESVLINGVECEPYLTTDYFTMQNDGEYLIRGAELLQKASGAKEIVIAYKVHKYAVREALTKLIADKPHIRLVEVPDAYPMGWEKLLISQVFKRSYEKLPSEAGVAVNNAQTAIAVGRALLLGEVLTHRLVTVSGDAVKTPGNILVPIGTPVDQIIAFADGYTQEEVSLLPGGPMTSKAALNDTFVVTPTLGGLTVIKPYVSQEVACLRCGACTAHCPAFLQPIEIKLALEAKDNERMEKLNTMKCVECGLCSYVCPSKIEVADAVKRAKVMVRFNQAKNAPKK